jgi:hypothetical protein
MGIRAIETLHLHPGVINRGGTDEHGGVGGGTRSSIVNGEKRSRSRLLPPRATVCSY